MTARVACGCDSSGSSLCDQMAADATERLSQYLQFLGAKSPDIDVYQVDVIWPAILAHHLLDLRDAFSTETAAFFPSQIQNDTVDGRLIAIPLR